ncbi:hypothetical protein Ddc_13644 [Ditylenchus destructor]|nr:hypothetical protein Ddc_13644 [Ditylenchus destructor]
MPKETICAQRQCQISNKEGKPAAFAANHAQNPGFSGLPEAITPGRIDLCRRDRYQSLRLTERKRLAYHTPKSERLLESWPWSKSGIFRIAGGHNSRQNRSLSARPVPIASSHREEAIGVSHARIRAAIRKLVSPPPPPPPPHISCEIG